MDQEKKYCVFCGAVHEKEETICKVCGKTLEPKENLWVDYLIDHTKDKLKGDIEDSLFETIKNYLLSHLYSMILVITVVVTAVAVSITNPENHIRRVSGFPGATSTLTLEDQQEMETLIIDFADQLDYVMTMAGNSLDLSLISYELEERIGMDSLLHMYQDRYDDAIFGAYSSSKHELVIDETTFTSSPQTKNMQELKNLGYEVGCVEVSYTVTGYGAGITNIYTGETTRNEYPLGTMSYLITFAKENGTWLIVEQINLVEHVEERGGALL